MVANSDVLDARQAGKYLGLHAETVRRFAREHKIPAHKVGAVWRFNRSVLHRWAEAQQMRHTQRNILIVDDEQSIREFLRRTLETEGLRVTTASRGVEALECIRREVPEMVFLDLKLPDMDGSAVLKEIRENYGHVPVVIFTGYPDSELMEQALRYSPVTILAKPASTEQILETAGLVLGRKKGAGETA